MWERGGQNKVEGDLGMVMGTTRRICWAAHQLALFLYFSHPPPFYCFTSIPSPCDNQSFFCVIWIDYLSLNYVIPIHHPTPLSLLYSFFSTLTKRKRIIEMLFSAGNISDICTLLTLIDNQILVHVIVSMFINIGTNQSVFYCPLP